jgi:hypothetical protein
VRPPINSRRRKGNLKRHNGTISSCFHREHEATCVGYCHPDTDAFATCLQRESLARRALTSYPPPPYFGYWGYGGAWWGP